MSSLLQLRVGTVVCACRITCLSSTVTFFVLMHPTATLVHTKVTDLTGSRAAPEVSEQSPHLQGVCDTVFEQDVCLCARLEPSVLFGPAVIQELLQQRCFGCVLDPSQSAISSSQMMCMTTAGAQPTHLLAMVASELDVPLSSYQSLKLADKHLCHINKCI